MQLTRILGLAAVLATLAGPALAAGAAASDGSAMGGDNSMMSGGDNSMAAGDSMMSGASMGMMQGGEVMTFMPDGHMGKAMVSSDDAAAMMQMATPLDHCVMIVTGADGKTYMVDTSSAEAKAECEKMAM